jgi:hypothetical protein
MTGIGTPQGANSAPASLRQIALKLTYWMARTQRSKPT